MGTKKTLIILCAFFALLIFHRVTIAGCSKDWAFFESEAKAKEIYAKKQIQIPCDRIDELLHKDDINGVYIAIRDAALFGDETCEMYITKSLSKLKKLDGAKDAVAFYSYKNGDPSGLTLLADSFDKNHNDFTVELFGFLDDWEISGRRLVRCAKYFDAVGSEILCDTIWWRCYLYGKEDFKHFWFKIGKEENVSSEILQDFYDSCCPNGSEEE